MFLRINCKVGRRILDSYHPLRHFQKLHFTAQAHLCFPLSDDPVNRETSQENRKNAAHELEDKNVMTKKVQNQFSPGWRMSCQKRTADDSKPTGAHTSHIHKNRRISSYKNCTSRLHSDELRTVNIHMKAAANHLWRFAIR